LVTRVGDVLTIQTAELAAPSRTMAATWVAADRSGREIALYFGQAHTNEPHRLIALLVVHMAATKVAEFIGSENNANFFSSLTNRTKRGIMPEIDDTRTATFPSDRQVFERASVPIMACNDDEGELWLYRVSPWELHRNASTGNLDSAVQPVVGIIMRIECLIGLVNRLRELVQGELASEHTEKTHE